MNLIKPSPYFGIDCLSRSLVQTRGQHNVLSINAQSLNSKYYELVLLLNIAHSQNILFHVVCVQETWLSETFDYSLVAIDGYNCIHQSKRAECSNLGGPIAYVNKQRFLTPGHQGWNDLHRLCRIGMEYYLPNNDNNINNSNNNNNNKNNNNNNKTMMMMMIIIIRMMTMMIIGTTTIMIMIIIITTTLTMTIMKMIMIKTAQTPCQSLYKDRRIQNKIAWYNWYNRDDVMLILHEMLHTCSIMHTQWRCKFENTKHRCLGMFLHKCNLHCSGRN